LFTRSPPASEQVRHFSLEIVAANVELIASDNQSLEIIRSNLMDYVHQTYGRSGIGKADTPHIQNKLAQVLTNLFVALYDSTWQSVFDDFLSMTQDGLSPGGNSSGPVLYFRFLGSVHDEIADTMIHRSGEKTRRTTLLRDLIRERDALKIANLWQELLSKWTQVDPSLMEMCLRTIARWVGWSDISMVVTQPILNALLEMAGQQDVGSHDSTKAKLRDAAIEAFTAIATKKMRPAEKIELINVLNIQTVVSQLISSQPLEQFRNTPDYDSDLAESVAKLVNYIVRDLIGILDSSDATHQNKQEANVILQNFLPFLLRFFADEYDEICSTVIDGLMELLTFLRRVTKEKAAQSLPAEYANMLPSILTATIQKMRFDDTADWGADGEETDEAEFQDLRKRLNALQSQVTFIDENLVLSSVSDLVLQTFSKYSTNSDSIDWRDLELALYQMYLFGDYATKAFSRAKAAKPSPAADKLGEMMLNMVGSS
jgi:exportin-T